MPYHMPQSLTLGHDTGGISKRIAKAFGDSRGHSKRSLLRHEWVEKVEKGQPLIVFTRRTGGYEVKAGDKAEENKRGYFSPICN